MFEERIYEVTTLTHLYIGSGESLQASTDFLVQGTKVIVLDQEALANILNEKGYLKDFTDRILTLKTRFDLKRYLVEKRLNDAETLERIKAYSLNLNLGKMAGGVPLRQIKTFIKTAGRPFVPGSSIKGALRVAFLYNLLKRADIVSRERFFRNALGIPDDKHGDSKKEKSKKEVGRTIDQLLSSFILPGTRGAEPHSDIFRAMRISDSEPLDPSALEVIPINVLVGNSRTKALEFVEALKPGITFKVRLWIDKRLLELFKSHNPSNIQYRGLEVNFEAFEKFFEKPFAFSKTMIDDYMQTLRKAIPSSRGYSSNLRLGWGKGQIASTVFNLLPGDLKLYIRKKYFGQNTPIPISQKTFDDQLLGFCLVTRLTRKTQGPS